MYYYYSIYNNTARFIKQDIYPSPTVSDELLLYFLAVLYMKTLNFCFFLTVEIFFFSKDVKKRHPVILRTSFLAFLYSLVIYFILTNLFIAE
jgi:hypothetical protein